MELFLKRTLSGFVPDGEPSGEAMRKYKVGDVYRAKVTKPRSYQHHKLAFALWTLTYENLPEQYAGRWPSFEHFRKAVTRAAGHVIEYVTIDGEIIQEADSISFERLDEIEFTEVMGAMMSVCATILRMESDDLAAEVERYAA